MSDKPGDIDFIYNETTSQILLILDGDIQSFLIKLSTVVPDMKFFYYIPLLQPPYFDQIMQYKTLTKEYALRIMEIVHRCIGYRMDVDYLLENTGDDYLVIHQVLKG